MKNKTTITATSIIAALVIGSAHAHDGRRFDIQIQDGQLVAQGYISGDAPVDDGNGVVRDYYNAVHAHWDNIGGLLSRSTLPGFDIENQDDLLGDALWLTITGIKKWENAPFADFAGGHGSRHGSGHVMPHLGGHVMTNFVTIPTNEWVQVGANGSAMPFNTAVQLDDSIGLEAHFDLTFDYQSGDPLGAGLAPDTALYLVEMQLSTSDLSIRPSDTIHAILSPSGMTVSGSHGLSLATEAALGTPVPEPASIAMLALLPVLMRRRRG